MIKRISIIAGLLVICLSIFGCDDSKESFYNNCVHNHGEVFSKYRLRADEMHIFCKQRSEIYEKSLKNETSLMSEIQKDTTSVFKKALKAFDKKLDEFNSSKPNSPPDKKEWTSM